MNTLVVIPARLESSRLPGKPLVKINGKELIWHVRSRCQGIKDCRVVVATCNDEIIDFCRDNSWEAVMTSSRHERATDRVGETLEILEKERAQEFDNVIMVQGDEPMVTGTSVKRIAQELESGHDIVNLVIEHSGEPDPRSNKVKVVLNRCSDIIYLSRCPIPGHVSKPAEKWYQQTGLIGFSKQGLKQFSEMEECDIEKTESIDMNRWLFNNRKIRAVVIQEKHCSVDIPEDIVIAEAMLKEEESA